MDNDDESNNKRTRVIIPPLEWRPMPKTTELFRQDVPELRGLAEWLRNYIEELTTTRH
jgi:hypothetical protein